MSLKRASLYSAVLFAMSLCAAPAVVAQDQASSIAPPIERFFNNESFSGAVLSPDGRHLAARTNTPGYRDTLIVIDLAANSGKIVARHHSADVAQIRWVNNERLMFNVSDKRVGAGNVRHWPGLFAVNRDGSNLRQLVDRGWDQEVGRTAVKLLPPDVYMHDQTGAQDSDYVYVQQWVDTGAKTARASLLRLNTVTGQSQEVSRPAGNVSAWLLDQKGEPRIAVGSVEDETTIHYLDPATKTWGKLATYKAYGNNPENILPLKFGPDGTLYVVARNHKDTSAVYTFNFQTGKINPEPLLSTAGYDFTGTILSTPKKVLGMMFTTDATSIEWFDPEMKAIQQTVDALLPATNNLIAPPPQHSATPWLMVTAYSDLVPATSYLYNRDTKLLNKVGESRPGIDPKQMGQQQPLRYKARDGLEIPALLTMPAGAKRTGLPMVVLVHGGPFVRGTEWGWNPYSQFLASRGYVVLEPEFRGSAGYGAAHLKAGFKQWGLAMQNDVADGVRWAIDKGIVDPKRVCIAGASYGGYATLMGLVNDHDMYQCGVNWVGVTDINLMYSSVSHESDISDEWKRYGMPEMIGDRVKDAAQLKATSPIEQASRIKRPLLLAYGGADRRVPIDHGTKFHAAVKRTNPNVEWVEYPDEGHGFYVPKNNIDFWSRVEKFLDKHIGSGAAAKQ